MEIADTPLTSTGQTAPVLLSTDELLVAEVRRLAAAAGVSVTVVADLAAAARTWATASVLLVGVDLASACAAGRPARREQVHVVGHGSIGNDAFRHAVHIGAESVTELPSSQEWLVELLTDAADGLSTPGVVIGVVGGAGGVGATVFATALARCAAAVTPTLLVDLDLLGAGVDRVLGVESSSGIRWDAMMAATGRLSARSLREALPRADDLSVLAFPTRRPETLPGFAVREILSAARRGFGCVVLDLPRSGDAAIEQALARCDRLVLVSTLTLPAVTAASRVAARLPQTVPTGLVTRGGAGNLAPSEVSRLLGVPLLHAMTDQRGLDEAINLGAGPLRSRRGTLARAARRCLPVLLEDAAAA
ncbi:septum site-determining protein Ssd [Nocardioides terrisoli]|uniref:septum site-determining protein Ssd n=1 Tax=Nocardioides terrisoli TaxID=3388267 RepID=UPI00287BAA34|nr:septum site-determining protein Ssd [Nocardioides marmorisolisilvae]